MAATHDRPQGHNLYAAPLLAPLDGGGRVALGSGASALVTDVGLTRSVNRRCRLK